MSNPLNKVLRNQVLRNMAALSSVQLVNYLVPLIAVPLVVRSIGVEKFGSVVFMQSLAMILAAVADYGFNITATRQISTHKGNRQELAHIVNKVLFTKISIFLLLALVIFTLHAISWPWFFGDLSITVSVILIILGNTTLPVWFFQGIQKMSYITWWNALSKIAYLILIIALVKSPDDYILVLLFYGTTGCIASFVTWLIIQKKFNIHLSMTGIGFDEIQNELKSGLDIFLSNLAVVSIMNSNALILGLFVGGEELGYYGIAEKVYLAIWQLGIAFSQAIFPTVCNLMSKERPRNAMIGFLNSYYVPFLGFITSLCVAILLLAEPVILFFTGSSNPEAVELVRILAIVPTIIILNMPANQIILASGFNSTQKNISILIGLINIAINFIFAKQWGVYGTALSVLLTHIMLTSIFYINLYIFHPQQFIFSKKTA